MAKLRILVDANIIYDVLAQRVPFYSDPARVWASVETELVEGCIAAHTATTLFYLISRYSSRKVAVSALQNLLRVFQVALVDQAVLIEALLLDWPDFEDAVQASAALHANAVYLIRRVSPGFPNSPVPVISPTEFGRLMAAL
jgi:predicted nucleic acid-binding protein